ncbi:MAG: tetratricopeptide repeat protein [bacterium]|nr:tetratricopeptide repeat protein [bacterium]
MEYKYLNDSLNIDADLLPESTTINRHILKNCKNEIIKILEFFNSKEKILNIHGFIGTGKRQLINYVCEFLNKDVISLEYYCKESTVNDDILLAFTEEIQKHAISKIVSLNAKLTTLGVKFQKQISSIKKPFIIILHTFDNISNENITSALSIIESLVKEENVKIIISTTSMKPDLFGGLNPDKKVLTRAFSKEIFAEFIKANSISASDRQVEDFYKVSRGYYFYTALSVKIIQAMNISLGEFLEKLKMSEMTLDSYLGATYINLIPTAIRNFFWFMRLLRHGISLNALAVLEIYDEFTIEYLKANLVVFEFNEIIYLQDYFAQKTDVILPQNVEIKLHKYIIETYEKQLKEPVNNREILLSRQALRAEIEYHNQCIDDLENEKVTEISSALEEVQIETPKEQNYTEEKTPSVAVLTENAKSLIANKKYSDAINCYHKIIDSDGINLSTLVEARLQLANLYKKVGEYSNSYHYYELVEVYYKQHKESINLSYLYYEMTDLYHKMYKIERATETAKQIIYSPNTPPSLLVSSCILLGNIYSEINKPEDAYTFYSKALDSLDENVPKETLAELYFKYALANDDNGNVEIAYTYYNKCIAIGNSNYISLAYSNMASCYAESENYEDALACFIKSYSIEKHNNNYEGIYYTAVNIGKIYMKLSSSKALEYLTEAKQSADFINDNFSMTEAHLLFGDYCYNISSKYNEALKEYYQAYSIAKTYDNQTNLDKIEKRIADMKLRMKPDEFMKIKEKYDN